MTLRISDLFDIVLISVFIYSTLLWFKRTTSRRVVIGIFLMSAVYFLAKVFDLYLTLLLFRTVFAVLLVALVVVFQEEIRRGFERIALWGTFRDGRRYARLQGADALIEGVSSLASNRLGALIVIKGREPLDRHVQGGIPLYGRLSKPLLYSIFDPHSPGHDGAVLIEGERISKFGAHLPLSKNLVQVGMLGTRHTAALGMSECSDSFVIVVSEETGTIRAAQDGRLAVMHSVAELKGQLERFYQEKFPHHVEPDWKLFITQNGRIKVLSLFLAALAWWMFAYRPEVVQRTFAVPIEYRNLPDGWVLEGVKTPEVMITLSGSERAFKLLNPSSLVAALDLGKIQEGEQRLGITEEDLRRPSTLKVYRIDPNLIAVEGHRMMVVKLPVEVQTQGQLLPHLELKGIKVAPETVRAMVRLSAPERPERIRTDPVDLGQVTQTSKLRVGLQLPREIQLLDPEVPEVRVLVEVAEKEKEEGK